MNQTQNYQQFLDFIAHDFKQERKILHRKMLNVLIWCFFLPVIVSLSILLAVYLNILSSQVRFQIGGVFLVFPVLYALYIFSIEVLVQVPRSFRKGDLGSELSYARSESLWRDQIIEKMQKSLPIHFKSFSWIVLSFKIDLERLRFRTKYLTILAGTVFFLIMQGLDYLTETDPVSVFGSSGTNWTFASGSQLMGLGLFLTLFYLSGSHTHQSLKRYLDCIELLLGQSS